MLNNLLRIIIVTVLFYSPLSHARERVMVFSPHQSPATKLQQARASLEFMTSLKPGDRTELMDGFHLKTIGTFTIPESKAYNSPKARLGTNSKAVGALMQFARKVAPNSVNGASVITGALRLPQLLRTVGENYTPTEPLDVIVLGSPFYDDPKEAVFSMVDGLFPSDAHLKLSRAKTPYGTADNPDALKNLRVHLGFEDEVLFPNDQQRFYVQRFWTLYIEQQGGALTSFTANLPALFTRVKRNAPAPKHSYKIDPSDKLDMIRLRRKVIKQSIYERPVSTSALPAPLLRNAPSVEIGITWDCATCDLDLFAQPSPKASILFFGHNQSPEGEHFKDYQQSPRRINGYETIAFNVPLDLRALKIGINFYAGKSPKGVTGELRLSVDGQTYAHRFHLASSSGNKGDGMKQAFKSGKSPNDHTVMIDTLSMVTTR